MANGVKFIRQNGGLARTLAGSDHISGLIVYGEPAVSPALLLSPEDKETAGITAATNPVLDYHVDEYFRINPGSKLYVESVADSDGTYTEIKTLQNFAGGDIRQIGICDYKTAVSELQSYVANLNQVVADLAALNIPLSAFLSVKVTAANMLALPDLHQLNAERVSVVIAQDAGGRGKYLATANPSIGVIGAIVGATSRAKVHESIGWVERQNLVSTSYPKELTGNAEPARELDVIGFADGSLLGTYTPQQVQAIADKGYLFMVKYTGNAGSFFNDSFTASELTGDFAYIENNRTIDKAIRGINRVLLPKISGPAYIDPDTGLIDHSTIAHLESLCEDVLEQMQRDGEISGSVVSIDPAQQILRTSKLEVVVKIIPVGTMREITVKIGLTLKKD